MIGITEKDMQAVINTYDLKPYYYPTLFPLKENYTLTSILQNSATSHRYWYG